MKEYECISYFDGCSKSNNNKDERKFVKTFAATRNNKKCIFSKAKIIAKIFIYGQDNLNEITLLLISVTQISNALCNSLLFRYPLTNQLQLAFIECVAFAVCL